MDVSVPGEQPRLVAGSPRNVDELDMFGCGGGAEDAVVVLRLSPRVAGGGGLGEQVDPVGGDAFVVAVRADGVPAEV